MSIIIIPAILFFCIAQSTLIYCNNNSSLTCFDTQPKNVECNVEHFKVVKDKLYIDDSITDIYCLTTKTLTVEFIVKPKELTVFFDNSSLILKYNQTVNYFNNVKNSIFIYKNSTFFKTNETRISLSSATKLSLKGCGTNQELDTNGNCCPTNCKIKSCDPNGGQCNQCDDGYFLRYSICNPCIDGCNDCLGLSTCLTCKVGYYITDESTCLLCNTVDPHCISCTKTSCNNCENGYYNSMGSCQICPSSCKQCSTDSPSCLSCPSNYVIVAYPAVGCEPCSSFDPNCKTCDSSFRRRCYECNKGYYPSQYTEKCEPCSTTCESDGCNTFNGVCNTCIDLYTKQETPNQLDCEPCPNLDSNCQTCSKTTRKCNTCKAGYYPLTVSPFTCQECDETCGNNCDQQYGYCTSCKLGYVLKLDSNSLKCESCQLFDPNCQTCKEDGERKCLICNNKYKPASNGICIKCDSTCLDNCDGTNGICTKCTSGYVPYNPTQTICQQCTKFDANCIQCATNSTRTCVNCKSQMYPSAQQNGDVICVNCSLTCADCDTTNGNCKTCSLSNWVVTEPLSIQCEMCSTFDSNCVTCSVDSSRVCTTCKSGLRPNTTSGKCVECGLHCASGACDPTSGICNQCDANYVFQSTKTDQCESCSTFDANCITCASDSTRKCKQCKAGYYSKTSGDFKCQSCDVTCGGKCDKTTGMCAGCQSGYVPTLPITNKCETCQTFDLNCVECKTNQRKCINCQSGMYPNTNGICTLCDTTCNGQCNASTGVCTRCATNHVFDDPPNKVCVACKSFDTNCNKCASDNTRRCYQCEDGYYPASDGACVRCASGCATCSPITGVCSKCVAQYVPSLIDKKLCLSCNSFDSNCLQCATTFTRTCTTCKTEAMYPQNGICVPCDSPCNGKCDPTNGNCRSCLSGNVLTSPVSKVCESCQTFDSHCQANSCASNGSRICTNCTAGYFPQSDGRCGLCDTTCGGMCNTVSGVCTGCSSNHVYNPSNTKTCRTCSLLDANCSICDSNFRSEKCVSCIAGYYPDSNGKCMLCDNTCGGKCDTSTGVCTGCLDGYVKNGMNCISCAAFNVDCETCDSNYEKKCTVCKNNKYSVNGVCVKCDEVCDNCDGVTGKCKSCSENSVVQAGSTDTCETCSTFDSLCVTCASDATRNCVKCTTNNYPVLQSNGEKRCQQCDTTCNGNCNTETGYCKSCLSNYVFVSATSLVCENCTSFEKHCTTCSPTHERRCVTCNTGYRSFSDGNCVLCDSTCANSCDGSTGNCLSCKTGYVLSASPSQRCITCEQFDMYCAECPGGAERKCKQCKAGYYPKTSGDFKCQSCDVTCGGQCNTVSGMCTGCQSGYVPDSVASLQCVACRTFDTNCVKCVDNKRECAICDNGMYPNTNGKCTLCDTSCNGQCNASTGVCTSCATNHVFDDPPDKVCVACKSFDTNCITCSPDFSRKCKVCVIGFYPDDASGKCVACSTISNCNRCSSETKKCMTCKDPFIQRSGGCEICPIGEYKFGETTCSECYNNVDFCDECQTISVGQVKCTKCISPYVLNGTKCVLCENGYIYDNTNETPVCTKLGNNCELTDDAKNCILCGEKSFISNGKCVSSETCESPSLTSCDCSDQISINSICTIKIEYCKYQKSERGIATCINCVNNYTLNDGGVCEQQNVYGLVRNGVAFGCKTGQYLTTENTCDSCGASNVVCTNQNSFLKCGDSNINDIEQLKCTTDLQCDLVLNEFCVQCKQNDMEIIHGKCTRCQIENCKQCVGGMCQLCNENYLMYNKNRCVINEQVNCERTSQYGCVECKNGYYSVDTKNTEDNYQFCTKITLQNCKHISFVNSSEICLECLDAFKMKDGICADNFNTKEDDHKEEKQTLYSSKSVFKKAEKSECQTRNNKGCQRCPSGYYLNKNSCEKCSNECLSCYNATYCISCNSGYFLDSSMKCRTLGELEKKCDVTLPTGGGCAICKVGYYKVEKDCNECDKSCDICVKKDECLSCKEGYFKIPSESNKLCLSNTTLSNCLESNFEGCESCENSYYLQNGRCLNCEENCLKCYNADECISCANEYILSNGKCVYYSTIVNCILSNDSKCIKCDKNSIPSDDGDSCIFQTNYGLVVGTPISIVIVLIIIFVILFFVFFKIYQTNKKRKDLKNICTFDMSRSNVEMVSMNNNLCTNKPVLKFDLDDIEQIPVDSETRDLVCVGNTSKHKMKIQFSVLEGCDNYKIRTTPSLVTLKKGEACEFEIFIEPLCSCHLEEDIMVIALDIETGVQYNEKIQIEVLTENSTKLNYKELNEEKKIGEGSFGIVYKGNYRGNTVAIKRMKESTGENNDMTEFTKEVTMLDKFRSDYIVHFYGAVFIPNKVCMVTEFAQFGSLQDLMKNKKTSEISNKLRVKIGIDAAKGILYLHENGILHRDIKPDNILVVSLDINVTINGKLTDFGSSRNVNLLTTNMTFTKGIGTPVYMAPEVLSQQKYKRAADVYSFGVTMYETFKWGEAYDKERFRFPWKIAEFVMSGKRLEKHEIMSEEVYLVIKKCWCHAPIDRIEIEEVVKILELINSV
ncbi:protein serine/threonine kinase, putative [Entamoeba invadens IP1]|uniref:Protein serine/threonine kinase, putative n=1 Tax=Entamoeba invadens IP1 TaxID=370355 RepID=L7FN06_ENTIV|nr:protein serine/threonine kinase, putative [Entamoeba invadens IP1]ELP87163.1 protein serine/threonine kinase, putative [Entamoeba invadens IP1]|eukprot:XP_004253934.1 protein serine/threonine kinase, putative [Entamoeba invadens IP1]